VEGVIWQICRIKMQVRETLFIELEKKVEDYLTYLAVQANVAASSIWRH